MMDEKPHILVVDDDDRLRGLLKRYLSEQGFLVTVAANAENARKKLAAFIFDLLVLDIMMPKETGFEFLESLGSRSFPVLFLSAMAEVDDRVKGLELGAEDYLTKPFEPKELVLRIKVILRRTMTQEQKSQIIQFGEFYFDLSNLRLKRDGKVVYLTSNEAMLLKFLANQPNTPLSREELVKLMSATGNERSVDVQMSRLRKKIEENDSRPVYIQTIRGAGYVLYAKKIYS